MIVLMFATVAPCSTKTDALWPWATYIAPPPLPSISPPTSTRLALRVERNFRWAPAAIVRLPDEPVPPSFTSRAVTVPEEIVIWPLPDGPMAIVPFVAVSKPPETVIELVDEREL